MVSVTKMVMNKEPQNRSETKGSIEGADERGRGDGSKDLTRWEHRAREVGEQGGSFFERLGISRLAGAVTLMVLGIVVLVFPELVWLFVGVGSLILGLLVLLSAEHS